MGVRSSSADSGTNPTWKERAQNFGNRVGSEAHEAMDNPLFSIIAWILAIGLGVALVRVAIT